MECFVHFWWGGAISYHGNQVTLSSQYPHQLHYPMQWYLMMQKTPLQPWFSGQTDKQTHTHTHTHQLR